MIALEGAPVVITDTAGIHASDDPIEALGIRKSEEAIGRADLILFVIVATVDLQAGDVEIYNNIKGKEHLVVQNKIDLCRGRPSPPHFGGLGTEYPVELSALTGEGLAALKQRILERIGLAGGPEDSAVLVNLRQRKLLEAARGHLTQAVEILARESDAELAVVELKDAHARLREILGQNVAPDVLDHIFQRFCIGK